MNGLRGAVARQATCGGAEPCPDSSHPPPVSTGWLILPSCPSMKCWDIGTQRRTWQGLLCTAAAQRGPTPQAEKPPRCTPVLAAYHAGPPEPTSMPSKSPQDPTHAPIVSLAAGAWEGGTSPARRTTRAHPPPGAPTLASDSTESGLRKGGRRRMPALRAGNAYHTVLPEAKSPIQTKNMLQSSLPACLRQRRRAGRGAAGRCRAGQADESWSSVQEISRPDLMDMI